MSQNTSCTDPQDRRLILTLTSSHSKAASLEKAKCLFTARCYPWEPSGKRR